MQDFGLVSIITATYNSSRFVVETIESILAQTYTHWELLITDDGSTDDTLSVVQSYMAKDDRIKLFCLDKNSGAGVARNHSIAQAQGRFIAFCDSDDCWLPEKLEKQLAFMLEKDAALSYTSYYVQNEQSRRTAKVICQATINYWAIRADDGIGCLTAIYDTQKLGKIFMPEMRKRQDWALWILIIQRCGIAYGLQEPLALYRDLRRSLSSNRFSLIKYNVAVYTDILHYSKLKAYAWFVFIFMPTYLSKKLRIRLTKLV